MQYSDTRFTKIPRALRFNDRVSMRVSTELREPFLDHRLFELAFKQPLERKIFGGEQKVFLRQLAKQWLPETIAAAPKRPIQTPQTDWFRGPLRSWVYDMMQVACDSRPEWVLRDEMEAEWTRHDRAPTPGFTGADLANVINEAALLTARMDRKQIDMDTLEESIDRVMAGPERKSRVMSDREKKTIAYHEGGHALVAHALPNADPVHKITIWRRASGRFRCCGNTASRASNIFIRIRSPAACGSARRCCARCCSTPT